MWTGMADGMLAAMNKRPGDLMALLLSVAVLLLLIFLFAWLVIHFGPVLFYKRS